MIATALMKQPSFAYRGWSVHRDVTLPRTHRWTASPDDFETVVHAPTFEEIALEIDEMEDEMEGAE